MQASSENWRLWKTEKIQHSTQSEYYWIDTRRALSDSQGLRTVKLCCKHVVGLGTNEVRLKFLTYLDSLGRLFDRFTCRCSLSYAEQSVVCNGHRRSKPARRRGVAKQFTMHIFCVLLFSTNPHVAMQLEDVVMTRVFRHHHLAVRSEERIVGIQLPSSSRSGCRLSIWPEQMFHRLVIRRPLPYNTSFWSFTITQHGFIGWLWCVNFSRRLFRNIGVHQRTREGRANRFCVRTRLRFFCSFRRLQMRLRAYYYRLWHGHQRFFVRDWHGRSSCLVCISSLPVATIHSTVRRSENVSACDESFLANFVTDVWLSQSSVSSDVRNKNTAATLASDVNEYRDVKLTPDVNIFLSRLFVTSLDTRKQNTVT